MTRSYLLLSPLSCAFADRVEASRYDSSTSYGSEKKILPRRFVLVGITFFLSVLLYVDRACISAAKEPIQNSLALSDEQMGWVLSSFALGYALSRASSF